MGSDQEERGTGISTHRFRKIVKKCIACLASFLMSMVGGFVLVFWELKFHPTNSQLWMVPLGLILSITPVIACFTSFISDVRSSNQDGVSSPNQPVANSMDNPIPDIDTC
ncbi:Group XV phospholipase [Actinidia chinensis var. chinensis]|uniref:Group XV phospholipase n=1 Tax=Actinidia chinensis var. chinensis TaxID=1590841 RepID=A0A2R6RCF3_ACTCC|nr:Group XV phospholipase [Actinidia chinensis var. chinensis]